MSRNSLKQGIGTKADGYVQPGRQGKKALVLYVDQAAHKAVKQVALLSDMTVEHLIERALHEYLLRHNHRQEAQLLSVKQAAR